MSKYYGLPSSYDAWKTSPPEDDEIVHSYCKHCEGEIYVGDTAYKVDVKEYVHEECFLDWAYEELDVSLETVESDEPDYDDYLAEKIRDDF